MLQMSQTWSFQECPDWDKEANFAEFNEEETMLLMTHAEFQER